MTAFANCGRAVAHVQGSYVPQAAVSNLFDHLVGAQQERIRDRQAEPLGGREIDDKYPMQTAAAALTGISLGFVPRKILSTHSVVRRNTMHRRLRLPTGGKLCCCTRRRPLTSASGI